MNTTINGQPMQAAIMAEILRQIQELNPEIHPEEYTNPKDIPGFEEVARLPRFLVFSQTSDKLNQDIRRKIFLTKRRDPNATLDLRTGEDGKPKKAVAISSRTKRVLWEMETDWDIMMARTGDKAQEASPQDGGPEAH